MADSGTHRLDELRARVAALRGPGIVAARSLELTLSDGSVALVDDDAPEYVLARLWRRNPQGYAVRTENRRTVFMHRIIIGALDGLFVDHVNGDTLDNRRSNLRLATKSQNGANSRKRVRTMSRFKGVIWNRRFSSWSVQIKHEGRATVVGPFPSQEQAAIAYDDLARKLHGEFACLNFPHRGERSALTGEVR